MDGNALKAIAWNTILIPRFWFSSINDGRYITDSRITLSMCTTSIGGYYRSLPKTTSYSKALATVLMHTIKGIYATGERVGSC